MKYGHIIVSRPLIALPVALCLAWLLPLTILIFIPWRLPGWVWFVTSMLMSYGTLCSIKCVNRRFRIER